MDIDVITALSGALAGAAIAGVFSILVGNLQSGRDHDRWVREFRYSAYSDFLVAIDAWHEAATSDWIEARFSGGAELASHRAATAVLAQELNRSQSRVALIGPDVVRASGEALHVPAVERAELAHSLNSLDDLERLASLLDLPEITEHRATLLALMNHAIGIVPRRRFQPRFRRVE